MTTTFAKTPAEALAKSKPHQAQPPRQAARQADDQPAGQVVLTCGNTITPQAIRWLWHHWIALGKLMILAGAPGAGKTTLALSFVATLTSGGRWPDGSRSEVGSALVWSGEDDPADTLVPRLLAMGANMSRVYFVTGSRRGGEVEPFDPARDMTQLAAAVEGIGGVRLLVVDPVVSAVAGDSHKNAEVRRGLQPLVDLAAKVGAAVVGITHLSKGTAGRDPTERVTGSIAFGAVARIVLLAAKSKGDDGGDHRVLVRTKANIAPDDGGYEYFVEQAEAAPGIATSIVTWGGPVEGTARDILAESEPGENGAPEAVAMNDEAVDALKRILGRDTVPSRAVLDQMKTEGYTEKMTRTARERIGVQIKRSGAGKDMASYWRLPDGVSVPADDALTVTESEPLPALEDQSCPFVPIDALQKERAGMGTNEEAGRECDPLPDTAEGDEAC